MRALPGVVVAGAAVLVSAGLWWGTSDHVAGDPENAATALVPLDGAHLVANGEVTEHARLGAPALLTGAPPLVTNALAGTLDGDPFGWRLWRATTTSYDAAVGGTEQVTTIRRLTEDGVEQVAAYGPIALVFDPPLLELPADVEDGSEWSGKGGLLAPGGFGDFGDISQLGELAYEAELAATADGDGCLRVTGTVVFTFDGEQLADNPTDERWCEGRGVVPDDDGAVPDLDGATEPLASEVDGVEVWTEHDRPLRIATNLDTADTTAGPATPGISLAPVAGPAGRLLVADEQSRDVWAFEPRPDGTRVRSWVAHPGGDLLTLAAAGDVTVVGTSRRELVGYGPRGEWRWRHRLTDVPSGRALAVDEDTLVVTSAAGEVVALDPATGDELWSKQVADRVGRAPVTDGRTIVVADDTGLVTAYDVADGTVRWTAEVTVPEAMAVVGDVVVVSTPDAVQAFDVDDGERLWSSRIPFGGAGDTVADLGSTVAVSTVEGTVGLDVRDGHERWRADGGDVGLAVDRHLFLLDGRRLSVLDGSGDRVRGWTVGGLRTTTYLAATATGVLLMDGIGGTSR